MSASKVKEKTATLDNVDSKKVKSSRKKKGSNAKGMLQDTLPVRKDFGGGSFGASADLYAMPFTNEEA